MSLRANVYVAPPIPWILPGSEGQQGGVWQPTSITLIHGDKEALLVDTPITAAATEDLIKWINETIPHKGLTMIYITHGHPDHWLGLARLKKRFPSLRAFATKGTLEHMQQDAAPAAFDPIWRAMFPNGQLDEPDLALVEPLPPSGALMLEGQLVCQAVEVGHSDTHDSTFLWVPSLKLAVCGDIVYGDVHQWLVEANTQALRDEWVAAIEKIESFGPEMVVPSHKKAGELAGTFHLRATKDYIRSFGETLKTCKSREELYEKMVARYPTRFNPFVLAWSSKAAFGLSLF